MHIYIYVNYIITHLHCKYVIFTYLKCKNVKITYLHLCKYAYILGGKCKLQLYTYIVSGNCVHSYYLHLYMCMYIYVYIQCTHILLLQGVKLNRI